jgi:hypothetical protein
MSEQTWLRRVLPGLVLTIALLPWQGFFPVAMPDRGTLAQEKSAAASPSVERPPEVTPSPTEIPTAEPTATPSSEATVTLAPSEKPTETPTESATSVPVETPAPTATATPSPTETVAPAAQSTSTPSAPAAAVNAQANEPRSAAATNGGTGISPNHSERVAPGVAVTYLHTVTNKGRSADFKNITAASQHHWPVELLEADGVTALTDHTGDRIPDTGRLARGQKTRIYVRVTVPANAPAGVKDKTTVMAASALFNNRGSEDVATDTTTVTRVLTLEMGTTEVDFGLIAADGRLDGAAPGVTSQVDDRGAFYVKEEAIRVVMTANVPWTGSCVAAENSGTAAGVTIAGGRLQWRLNGTTDWTPFPSTTSGAAEFCFPSRELGTNTYVYDVRLRVERTDAPGTFRSTLTFTASP